MKHQTANIAHILLYIFIIIPFSSLHSQITLHSQNIQLKKGLSFNVKVPVGYRISVAAEGLERPRFFAKAPDGRLFVTDMHNRDDNKQGRIVLLENWNDSSKSFEKITPYLNKLHNPNQIAFYSFAGVDFMYLAQTGKLSVYPYIGGSVQAADSAKTIATFPNYGLSYKYGGWHLTRSLAFHNNKLYVSVGSSCNACVETEPQRASIIEMNPDGSNQRVYASGVRNAVGITWVGNQLWATNMGRDLIGPDKPQDLLINISEGKHYGWPYYYQYKQRIEADKQFKDSTRPKGLKPQPVALCGFLAHSAPLGLAWFNQFNDSLLNNHFLVALHGSTSVWRQRGNEVVMVTGRDKYTPVVTGFLQGKTENKRFGRPCDIIQWNDRSFFISDDKNGVIYYVWKEN
jgi:glucose/arabinose dehydrogenase